MDGSQISSIYVKKHSGYNASMYIGSADALLIISLSTTHGYGCKQIRIHVDKPYIYVNMALDELLGKYQI
jgi:hypothetical protein